MNIGGKSSFPRASSSGGRGDNINQQSKMSFGCVFFAAPHNIVTGQAISGGPKKKRWPVGASGSKKASLEFYTGGSPRGEFVDESRPV